MAVYSEHECAIIHRNRDRLGGLSNMHNEYPLKWQDVIWPSSEALYQALRFPSRPDIQKYVREQQNGFAAKLAAYEFKNETRSDWAQVKVESMENVLRLKYLCHSDRIGALLALTGDMPIVEKSSRDDFWGARPDGDGKLEGQNVLGLLWMLIREELRGEFSSHVSLSL